MLRAVHTNSNIWNKNANPFSESRRCLWNNRNAVADKAVQLHISDTNKESPIVLAYFFKQLFKFLHLLLRLSIMVPDSSSAFYFSLAKQSLREHLQVTIGVSL